MKRTVSAFLLAIVILMISGCGRSDFKNTGNLVGVWVVFTDERDEINPLEAFAPGAMAMIYTLENQNSEEYLVDQSNEAFENKTLNVVDNRHEISAEIKGDKKYAMVMGIYRLENGLIYVCPNPFVLTDDDLTVTLQNTHR